MKQVAVSEMVEMAFSIARANGTVFVHLGVRPMIDKPTLDPVRNVVYIPLEEDRTVVPDVGFDRLEMLRDGMRAYFPDFDYVGVVIGHEIREEKAKPQIDWQKARDGAFRAGRIAVTGLSWLIYGALWLATTMMAIDPELIAVMPSGDWIIVYSWMEKE